MGSSGDSKLAEHSTQSSNASTASSPEQTASIVRRTDTTNSIVPPQPAQVQNRLIELGYMIGPADGVWGNKSRAALRAFKAANSMQADDKWDEAIGNRLFSKAAARSPLPLAGR
jgi:peptidoglycan hydrolase-like protein with peptidoglycan-binding domain